MPSFIKSNRTRDMGTYKIPLQRLAVVFDEDGMPQTEAEKEAQSFPEEGGSHNAAAKILEEARQKAVTIVQEGYAAAEKLKQEAYIKGLEEGRAEQEQRLLEAKELVTSATLIRQEIIRAVEPQVVELSLKIAKTLLKTSVILEADLIRDIVAEAISLLAGEESIIVKVNPQDLAVCRNQKDFFKDLLTEDAAIRFLPSEGVEKGSCIVQGQFSLVESNLEERFQVLQEKLLEEAKNAGQGS